MSVDAVTAAAKERRLAEWLQARGPTAVGYSGGVDSAYLAAVALATLGPSSVLAVAGRSESYPESQWRSARDVAEHLGLPLVQLETSELTDPRYAANPVNRCYY